MSKDKKPLQSKKFIAFVTGVTFTTIFIAISLIIIGLVPEASSAVVNLMTVGLASINGMISIYALGQSAVDFRINSNHNTVQENKIESLTKKLILEAKGKEMKYDGLGDIDWNKVDFSDNENKGNNYNFNIRD